MSWLEILLKWFVFAVLSAVLPFLLIAIQLTDHNELDWKVLNSFWNEGELLLISMVVLGATMEDLWRESQKHPQLRRSGILLTVLFGLFVLAWYMDIATSTLFPDIRYPLNTQLIVSGTPYVLGFCLILRLGSIIIQKIG